MPHVELVFVKKRLAMKHYISLKGGVIWAVRSSMIQRSTALHRECIVAVDCAHLMAGIGLAFCLAL